MDANVTYGSTVIQCSRGNHPRKESMTTKEVPKEESKADHRYDRRDVDGLHQDEKATVYCIECRAYHRVQMMSPWGQNREVKTLLNEIP